MKKPIHIALDFDKTLAIHQSGWGISKVGDPIWLMVDRVREWVAKGYEITIFSARFSHKSPILEEQEDMVNEFLKNVGLPIFRKTAVKLPEFSHIIDDRAYHTIPNTGIIDNGIDI